MTFRDKTAADVDRLYEIWHAAVKQTHHFLSDGDFNEIASMVREQYIPSAELLIYTDAGGKPQGFMGSTNNNMDSLFVDPEQHGKGIGQRFVDRMKAQHDLVTVQVNEQNPVAHAFYKRRGFSAVRRDPTDDAGRPFPIIHLEWRCS